MAVVGGLQVATGQVMPDGYDTRIDEDGSNLSAGQKQLITIARAFLSQPQLLILDEATSSVDTRTEALIQAAMADLCRGRTCFVIAHRLSTIRDADTILVMDAGRIIERGSHDELLARRGFYHAMIQAAAPAPLVDAGQPRNPTRWHRRLADYPGKCRSQQTLDGAHLPLGLSRC